MTAESLKSLSIVCSTPAWSVSTVFVTDVRSKTGSIEHSEELVDAVDDFDDNLDESGSACSLSSRVAMSLLLSTALDELLALNDLWIPIQVYYMPARYNRMDKYQLDSPAIDLEAVASFLPALDDVEGANP